MLTSIVAQRVSDDSWMEDAEPFDPGTIPCCFLIFLIGYGIHRLIERLRNPAINRGAPRYAYEPPGASQEVRAPLASQLQSRSPPPGPLVSLASPMTLVSNRPISSTQPDREVKSRTASKSKANSPNSIDKRNKGNASDAKPPAQRGKSGSAPEGLVGKVSKSAKRNAKPTSPASRVSKAPKEPKSKSAKQIKASPKAKRRPKPEREDD